MAYRILGLLSLVLGLVACQGGAGSNTSNNNGEDPFTPGETGKAIKVTYIRFNFDPRTKKYVPEYRVMLSDGWRAKNGRSAREPFLKIYKNPFLAESIPDVVLAELVGSMIKFGLNDLRSTTPEMVDLQQLKAIEKTNQAEVAMRWRIINVETDDIKKTILFPQNDDRPSTTGFAAKFAKVEREVIKVAVQWTVQVTYEAPPLVPK